MTEVYKTPKAHEKVLAILKELSVKKSGNLPSNMGGKPYISATDLFDEVKVSFAEKNLILIPAENFQKHEVVQQGQRALIATVIEGHYTILSTEDGSSLTIQGVGDGLATGSAVSSNIASTNALKNALLRFFLAAETSVEDKAKGGVGEAENSPANAKIAKAQGGGVTRKSTGSPTTAGEYRTAILAAVKSGGGVADYEKVGNRISGKQKSEWLNDVEVLGGVLKALEAGEVE